MNLKIFNRFHIAFYIFISFGCHSNHIKYYQSINKADQALISEDYVSALKYYELSLKYSDNGLLVDHINALKCACRISNSEKANKYYKLISSKSHCRPLLKELLTECDQKLINEDHIIPNKNKFSKYIDSLLDVDQANRENMQIKDKRVRDSLHCINFLLFTKKNGFPSEDSSGVYCSDYGIGTNSYKLEVLLIHFSGLNNVEFDSVINSEYLKTNIPIEWFSLLKCNNTNTSFGNYFWFHNDTMYIGKKRLENIANNNIYRNKYGIPSVKEEYNMIKYSQFLRNNGFRHKMAPYYIELDGAAKSKFIPEIEFYNYLKK